MAASQVSDIPETPAHITVEWLNTNLDPGITGGASVTDIAFDDIGEGTGIFGMISRLDLTWDGGDGSAPEAVVAKMACTEPANLEVALALGIYERELRFFEDMAAETPLRIPQAYVAGRADDGRFVLLLEDMGKDFEVGDQVIGATVGQAERIVDALATLHAPWWQSPRLNELDWLPKPDAPAYLAAVPGIYRAGLPVLTNDWADRVPQESIELAHALDPKFEELIARTAQGPLTLAHSDTRLDNIFFAKQGDGVAFIDFQLMLQQRGTADLAYLIGTSMPTEDARENWERLLRRWHSAITDLGVTYSWDECVGHYRENALYYLVGAMSLIEGFDTGNARGEAMATAYTTRIANHIVDVDAAGIL